MSPTPGRWRLSGDFGEPQMLRSMYILGTPASTQSLILPSQMISSSQYLHFITFPSRPSV